MECVFAPFPGSLHTVVPGGRKSPLCVSLSEEAVCNIDMNNANLSQLLHEGMKIPAYEIPN